MDRVNPPKAFFKSSYMDLNPLTVVSTISATLLTACLVVEVSRVVTCACVAKGASVERGEGNEKRL
jgi:hypothetical protein